MICIQDISPRYTVEKKKKDHILDRLQTAAQTSFFTVSFWGNRPTKLNHIRKIENKDNETISKYNKGNATYMLKLIVMNSGRETYFPFEGSF